MHAQVGRKVNISDHKASQTLAQHEQNVAERRHTTSVI